MVVTYKRSRKLSQSMDEFNVSINGHSHTVLNFILLEDHVLFGISNEFREVENVKINCGSRQFRTVQELKLNPKKHLEDNK